MFNHQNQQPHVLAAGFTLIEFVITFMLVGIVAVTAAPILHEAVKALNVSYSLSAISGQGQAANTRMSYEIKNMRDGGLSSAQSSSIGFTDVDGNSITYSLSSTNLLRNSNILAQNISALSFAYYDASGAVTATLANVRYVHFSFTITESGNSETFENTIFLRNAT